ncbi:hypothetical protein MKX01_013103 [Papaver californicum]|nr:hypothetical protein MKX01_013103 [Papaver californicum]
MSLLSNGKYNQGSGKIYTSKAVQQRANNDTDDDRPCKIRRTSFNTTNLPGDCLNIIFNRLNNRDDRISFGLTCHQWLHIQNNNLSSLFYRHRNSHDESFPIHLKYLFLDDLPEITDFVTSNPPFSESKVHYLFCYKIYSDKSSSMFSWFPRLTTICLISSPITDKSLEVLAKCCSSLKEVSLTLCGLITDSGISLLLQNCRGLGSLSFRSCCNITGIGFLGCPENLTRLTADGWKLKPEGIKAIVSGAGLESLDISAPYGLAKVEEGSINTEAVITISKGCPLLKKLSLRNCKEVELQGWEAIGRNCKNLEDLTLYGCSKLCDLGLQALRNGCNKLSRLSVDTDNCCSSSALELFKRKKISVRCHTLVIEIVFLFISNRDSPIRVSFN